MRKVFKYPLAGKLNSVRDSVGKIPIPAPAGSIPLCVMDQPGVGPCLWMEVDPDDKDDTFVLYCVGTGHGVVPEDDEYHSYTYVDSVIDGQYVWHLYYQEQAMSSAKYPNLMTMLTEMAIDDGGDGGPMPESVWPDDPDLPELERMAALLTVDEQIEFACGEYERTCSIAEAKNIEKLHEFLDAVFNRDREGYW